MTAPSSFLEVTRGMATKIKLSKKHRDILEQYGVIEVPAVPRLDQLAIAIHERSMGYRLNRSAGGFVTATVTPKGSLHGFDGVADQDEMALCDAFCQALVATSFRQGGLFGDESGDGGGGGGNDYGPIAPPPPGDGLPELIEGEFVAIGPGSLPDPGRSLESLSPGELEEHRRDLTIELTDPAYSNEQRASINAEIEKINGMLAMSAPIYEPEPAAGSDSSAAAALDPDSITELTVPGHQILVRFREQFAKERGTEHQQSTEQLQERLAELTRRLASPTVRSKNVDHYRAEVRAISEELTHREAPDQNVQVPGDDSPASVERPDGTLDLDQVPANYADMAEGQRGDRISLQRAIDRRRPIEHLNRLIELHRELERLDVRPHVIRIMLAERKATEKAVANEVRTIVGLNLDEAVGMFFDPETAEIIDVVEVRNRYRRAIGAPPPPSIEATGSATSSLLL